MKSELTAEQQAALDDAFDALQPFYDPGDDGDGIRIALNAIAGIIGERSGIEVDKDDGLNGVLEALDADTELREAIGELYKIAGKGAYGDGLTKKAADRINELVEELEEPLTPLIQKVRPRSFSRAKARTSKARRSRKT